MVWMSSLTAAIAMSTSPSSSWTVVVGVNIGARSSASFISAATRVFRALRLLCIVMALARLAPFMVVTVGFPLAIGSISATAMIATLLVIVCRSASVLTWITRPTTRTLSILRTSITGIRSNGNEPVLVSPMDSSTWFAVVRIRGARV